MRVIRRTLLVVALLFAAAGLWAETVFTLAPTLTYGSSDIREYVYLYPSYKKLSELDWDAHDVYQYGVRSELMHNNFYAYAEFAVAQEGYCGLMQDYDWMFADPSTPNPHNYPISKNTHFSEHPVTLIEKNRIDIHAGWDVYGNKKLSLSLGGGFQYMRTKLSAHDGYLQYPEDEDDIDPWNENRQKYYIFGPGIDYQLDIESLWIDVRVSYSPVSVFELVLEGGISPWQEIRQDDWHLLRDIWFYDHPDSSIMYRALLSASYSVCRTGSFVLSGSILSLPYSDGNAYGVSPIPSSTPEYADSARLGAQLGGTGYFGWDVSFSYRIRIF